MGPGGSRGLQTRCGSPRGGLGGFDSHTPPPNIINFEGVELSIRRRNSSFFVVLILAQFSLVVAPSLFAQGPPPRPATRNDFSGWKGFSPPDNSFTAKYPGRPEEKSSTV